MWAARFQVGPIRLCVERSAMRAVLEAPEVTRAPASPLWLLGACSRAGRAVAVLDVACLSGLATTPVASRWVVVVETTRGPIGISADGPVQEVRYPPEPPDGSLIREVEPSTWMVDVGQLPGAAQAALFSGDDAV